MVCDRVAEVTYTRGDRGICYGRGSGFGPCGPSGRGTARGTATAAAGVAANATATGRAASRARRDLEPPRRPGAHGSVRDPTIGEARRLDCWLGKRAVGRRTRSGGVVTAAARRRKMRRRGFRARAIYPMASSCN